MVNKENVLTFLNLLKESLYNEHLKNSIYKAFHVFIEENDEKASLFAQKMPEIESQLKDDLDFFFLSDPASNSLDEIILTYPGYLAITHYRLAHQLFLLGYKIEARIITEEAHFKTGIDIHPGAEISHPFFIDHGTGIVIGETAKIGKRCKIYQGVTLGALSLQKGQLLKGTKRHPTIGDDVTIYAGASILGGNVTVGNNVVIGSNVFLLDSVEDNTKVILGKPELILLKRKKID